MKDQFTNKHNIPKGLCLAIAKDRYNDTNDKPSDYSATKLLSPIQQTELTRRYKGSNDIPQRDILDSWASFVGSVIHDAIEMAIKEDNSKELLPEQRFYRTVGDKVVSGKIDCIEMDGILRDWKTCTVWKQQRNDIKDWTIQANIYRWLVSEAGIKIHSLFVNSISTDWKLLESQITKGYPECRYKEVALPMWSLEETGRWVKQRVDWLEEAKELEDESLAYVFPCSMEDQWSRFEGVKLFKRGAKRATKVFKGEIGEAMDEAEEYVIDNKKFQTDEYYLEEVFGKKTRCESYCDVKNVCVQRMREQGIDPNNKPLF